MSLSELDKVDLVARTKERNEYMLVFIIDEPWRDTEVFRSRFLEKLNNYNSYFLDGQMQREYRDCMQKRIVVRVLSNEPIPEFGRTYVAQLADAFSKHGFDIEAKELD